MTQPLARIALATLLALTITAPARAAFEGVLDMVMTHSQKNTAMKYFVKDKWVRVEPQTKEKGRGAVIMDYKRKTMIMLMPEKKQYMEMALHADEAVKTAKEEMKASEPVKTGRTETILGYKCEEWVSKNKEGQTEMWLAKGLGVFSGMNSGHGKKAAWEIFAEKEGFFPLRVINRKTAGAEDSRMEVKNIEKKSLDSSLFDPPAGYAKMEMPDMGKMPNMDTMPPEMREKMKALQKRMQGQ